MFDCNLCPYPYPYLKTQVGQILPFKPLKGIGLGLLSFFVSLTYFACIIVYLHRVSGGWKMINLVVTRLIWMRINLR